MENNFSIRARLFWVGFVAGPLWLWLFNSGHVGFGVAIVLLLAGITFCNRRILREGW